MQANPSRDTGPELRLRKALRARRLLGYRKNMPSLPGKPDVVFTKAKVAVFLHGCFWHRCPTCNKVLPRANHAYWLSKLDGNTERDARHEAELEELGYKVVVVWECEIRSSLEEAVDRIAQALINSPGR